jgi:3-hydroxybutyryl-CoA dehydratase
MIGKTMDQLEVGQSAEFSKTISESDIYGFAGICGDLNPAHINQAYAEKTFFKGRIAHGMLVGSLISAVIGMQLPGPGTIYMKQELSFLAPVTIGETVTARVEVSELFPEKNRVQLKTVCLNQEGKTVIDGQALVMAPKAPKS